MRSPSNQTGLKLGLISLAGVAVVFALVFVFGPNVPAPSIADERPDIATLSDVLSDAPSQQALAALSASSPATYNG